jgi:predicted metal-dependent HD superfamily phosphohydrolase
MTLLLDPPAWPAHDRLWSHLVSDSSLHELRSFARAAGIPDRGFDLDHYDVPAERYDDLLAAGAVPLDGRALARRLATSGLRVPGHERRRAYRGALLDRWATLWHDGAAHPGAGLAPVDEVGADLVDRWREPHRVYHSRLHLADVLDRIDDLVADDAPGSPWHAAVALWFHDAVHDGATPADEEASGALVHALLTPLVGGPAPAGARTGARQPLTRADVAEVARLVLLTAGHDPGPDDPTGALVSDADLAVLGSTPARYARYVAQVRAEYGHVPDDAFRQGRAAVVHHLLALHDGPGLYRTGAGRRRWSAAAGANLRAEADELSGAGASAHGARPGADATGPGARITDGVEDGRHEAEHEGEEDA